MQHPLAGCQCPISLNLIPSSLEPPFLPKPQRPQAGQAWLIFYQWQEVACPCFGAQPLVIHPEHMGSDPKTPPWGRTSLPLPLCLSPIPEPGCP